MNGRVFFDTNLLIYLYSSSEPEKRRVVESLYREFSQKATISFQVINEFINVLYKKFKIPTEGVEAAVRELEKRFLITPFDLETQKKALRLKERYGFQYYDALIIATAREQGCRTLYSEDMQHGQKINEDLVILNPFVLDR